MGYREGGEFQRGVWLSFVVVTKVCVWEMYTLQLGSFSVTKSEHADLKGWADGIQSAA